MGNRGGALAVLAVAMLGGQAAQAACDEAVVQLRGDWGSALFNVAIADTVEKRALGLMFVEQMPSSAGMLFVYDEAHPVSFWMKNTLIPLDMIFADAQGVVVSVHENAIPGDVTGIESGAPVQYVLEINGGMTERLGIAAGSEMQHPAITDAAWACE